jgi:hypothetical protein
MKKQHSSSALASSKAAADRLQKGLYISVAFVLVSAGIYGRATGRQKAEREGGGNVLPLYEREAPVLRREKSSTCSNRMRTV